MSKYVQYDYITQDAFVVKLAPAVLGDTRDHTDLNNAKKRSDGEDQSIIDPNDVATVDPDRLSKKSAGDGNKSSSKTDPNADFAIWGRRADRLELTLPHTDRSLTIDLPATTAGGEPLRYTAELVTGDPLAQMAYELNQDLGLFFQGSYYTNYYGVGDKWLGATDGNDYFLTPEGALHRWAGSAAASPVIATLDETYYADPSKLHEAVKPNVSREVSGSTVEITRNRLIVTPGRGFTGDLRIRVTAGDQLATTQQEFAVKVTDAVRELSISDRGILRGRLELSLLDSALTDISNWL